MTQVSFLATARLTAVLLAALLVPQVAWTEAPPLQEVMGEPSYVFAADAARVSVTRRGGHVGPVVFQFHGREVSPLSVAPWWKDQQTQDITQARYATPLVDVLRGDFFCVPFGVNADPLGTEQYVLHGKTANDDWRLEGLDTTEQGATLHLSMETSVRPGRVDKWVSLREGQTAVYQRHRITGMAGPMNYGHHTMVAFPDREGAGLYSCSSYVYGQVAPQPFEDPATGGYCALETGAVFDDLARVPTQTGDTADLTRFPARRGYDDLVMLVSDPELAFAWNAVVFPEEGYAWFSIRPRDELPMTLLWISNGGRHYPPWNGRHVNVMGIEDVLGYFHYGIADSVAENPVSKLGHATSRVLEADAPFETHHVFGILAVPEGFGRVRDLTLSEGELLLTDVAGHTARTPLDTNFLNR